MWFGEGRGRRTKSSNGQEMIPTILTLLHKAGSARASGIDLLLQLHEGGRRHAEAPGPAAQLQQTQQHVLHVLAQHQVLRLEHQHLWQGGGEGQGGAGSLSPLLTSPSRAEPSLDRGGRPGGGLGLRFLKASQRPGEVWAELLRH